MVRILFSVFLVVVAGAFGLGLPQRPVEDPVALTPTLLRQIASTLAEEGRWADLRDRLAGIDEKELPAASRGWWTVTLADARWRAAAGSQNPDDGELQAARAALQSFLAAWTPAQPHDEVWAQAQESLGDWHWRRPESRNIHGALPHYQGALGFWAASPDIERARAQYLSIAFRLFEPDGQRDLHAWWLSQIPLEVVRDARSIAVAPAESARAGLILARRLLQDGHAASRREAIGLLRELTGEESPTAGRDEALHLLARELEQNGEPRVGPTGLVETKPAFEAALVLYRRLLAEYRRGTSAWRDDAEAGIGRILDRNLDLAVEGAFFPGSEVGYVLGWRNVGPIQLTLHRIDLARDVRFHDDRSVDTWVDSVDVERIEPVQAWTHVPEPVAPHAPGRDHLRLERAPAPGAYVLVARAGQDSARALVLVGSTAVMLKTSGDQALVWCFDARTSEPLRSADVWIAERWWDGGKRELATQAVRTDEDGLARITLTSRHESTEVFASVTAGERTAFASCGRSWWNEPGLRSRVLAFTDRAAYRPNQTVNWKAIARTSDGGAWRVPTGSKLVWKIYDPRGAVWKEGSYEVNAFGSVSGSLELTAAMTLGEYQLDAAVQQGNQRTVHAGRSVLFRLEEYRLPEFEVSVAPARTSAEAARPVLGDTLPIDVDVAFYSGGPVAGAAVEVVVTQRSWRRSWPRPYETRWGMPGGDAGLRSQEPWRDHGQVVLRQQLVTDARGHARFEIATPTGTGSLEYVVEARAVDASRREVTGSGTVRVGATEYDVDVRTDRRVYGPGRAVEVELEALDVNGRPAAATGLLRLLQERWHEVWLDPRGNEVEGEALDAVRRASTQFPPPSTGHPWKRIVARWESREIARFDVAIGETGKAAASATPRENGLYRAVWTSRDGRGSPVESEAWFHVADESLRELGGVADDLQLVVDRATVAPGEAASVVMLTPVSGRYVLVTLEGLKLFDARVVHVEGRAAFLRVPLTLDHVPDVYLNAFTANAGVPWRASEEITVPPADRLLTVEVRPDQLVRLPGEEGGVEVFVRDVHGEPVQAEVALAVVDDALAAIQADPTPEIGVFFHGDRRGSTVQTATTLDRLPFRRWILDQEGHLRDERDLKKEKDGGYGGPGDSVVPGGAGPRGRQEGAKLSAAPALAGMAEMGMDQARRADDSRNESGGELVVRSDFRETAFWAPHLVTDESGRARATFKYPESLTRWRITARAATASTQVGEARSSARTDKPLVARLAIPRFLVAEDVVTVSGLVDNKTEAPLRVRVELALDGPLALVGGRNEDVLVPAGETARVDWLVRSTGAGTGRLVLRATSLGGSDALDKPLSCIPGGVDSLVARAGRVGPSGELALVLDVPGQRVREATQFSVDVAPSLAVTMLDALPYLVDYPYGCTEQTLSRFLPAAIVAHTLEQRGLSPDEALARTYGGIEREHAAATHPKPGAGLAALGEAVEQGMRRLVDFQHGDGGWGWWKQGDSDRWMTAYVVWGLSLARDAGVDVPGEALQRGVTWLAHELVEAQSDAPLAAWMLHAIAATGMAKDDKMVVTALDELLSQREALDAYGRSLAVLACAGFGRTDDARRLAATLANGVQVDKDPESSRIGAGTTSPGTQGIATAHWGADGSWRRWSDSPVETTAFALRALLSVDPAHPLAEPAMRWLVQNRRGASWSNTRDTAIAVLALDRWLDRSGELARDVGYELFVNGKSVARRTVTAAEMLRAPARFTVAAQDVRDGRNEVRVVRTTGVGPLYVAASARFTSLERPIPARGNQVFVRREAWKLVPRPTLLAGWAFDRVPLEDGGEVKSGERVIVVLTVEAKNDLEYLLLEDPRAAGFEAVDVQSGGPAFARELNAAEVRRRFDPAAARLFPDPIDPERSTGRQRWAHRELRDRHAAWFLDRLPQGVWELSYELIAEVPGRFRALPSRAEAMYVPEIRGHGTDLVVGVLERARDM